MKIMMTAHRRSAGAIATKRNGIQNPNNKMENPNVCPEDCNAYNYTGYCNHLEGAQWIGTDGHTYTRTKGGIGHLDCHKCDQEKK